MFQLIQTAFEDFQHDLAKKTGEEKQDSMTPFYSAPANAQGGTTTYIARAIVNQLLDGNFSQDIDTKCVVQ